MIIAGTEGVASAMVDTINQWLPSELARLETDRQLQQGSISTYSTKENPGGLLPRIVIPYWQPTVEFSTYPALMIDADGVARSEKLETAVRRHPALDDSPEPDQDEYRRTYGLRVYGWVRQPSSSRSPSDLAQLRSNRDRLELALWRVLVGHHGIAENAMIDQNSPVTSYSDIEGDREGGLMAAFYIRLAVWVTEGVTTPILGYAANIDTEVDRF